MIIANESEHDAVIVVLSDHDKEEMDDFLTLQLPDRRTTRIVTRSGNPAEPINLELVQVGEAKSVIVLSGVPETATDEDKAAADARVIKALLAVVATRESGRWLNISAEILNPRLHVLARDISPTEITTLDGSEVLAKILVQTSRSIGLSIVYNEILSFDGAEMYFYAADWGDATFGSLSMRFYDGVPMGYRSGERIVVNPSPGDRLESSDEILILATDDSTIELQAEPIAVVSASVFPDRRAEEQSGAASTNS